MQAFLEAGFILKEDIIKAQHNTQTEGLWANLSRGKNFPLIMHEHLFVFRKPAQDEKTRPYAESMRWWDDATPAVAQPLRLFSDAKRPPYGPSPSRARRKAKGTASPGEGSS